jgi:predicted RNA-binding Zn-ribbon protein involved in translation (DUF1610 family)
VNTTRPASCLFCGQTVPLRAVTAALKFDCPACGPYEVTVGAINLLRDANTNAAARGEIRRLLNSGVERPLINLEVITALKAR